MPKTNIMVFKYRYMCIMCTVLHTKSIIIIKANVSCMLLSDSKLYSMHRQQYIIILHGNIVCILYACILDHVLYAKASYTTVVHAGYLK